MDNQITDLDRSRAELQYHAVQVPAAGPEEKRQEINGPVEKLLAAFAGRPRR